MMSETMKLLIGYDGSPCADAALDDVRRAGLPAEGVEAVVIAVAEVWLPPPPPSSYEIVEAARAAHSQAELEERASRAALAVKETRRAAERAAERVAKNFPGWRVTAEATSGSPSWEIIMRADQWRPDLVVVGSHGRSALGRFVLGSVSQKVLTEARCSVRVARGRVEVEDTPARLVVGVDGSPGSEAAVLAVAARRWPLKSEARVVVVEDPLVPTLVGHLLPNVSEWIEESNRGETQWMQKLAGRAAERLRAAELIASPAVLYGDPKRVLIEEAEKWGADSIFVGSTGFSNRFERFLLGSVSGAVAARAHCSVEVVRAGKAGEV
jgi:nucleotide-binding universal stress UspA family protein